MREVGPTVLGERGGAGLLSLGWLCHGKGWRMLKQDWMTDARGRPKFNMFMSISAFEDQSSSCLCPLLYLQTSVPHVYVHCCICRPCYLMFMFTAVFADHVTSCLFWLLYLQTILPCVYVHCCIWRPQYLMFMFILILILMCTNISAIRWQDPILGIASADKGGSIQCFRGSKRFVS